MNDFQSFAPHSKVWIYQANRALTNSEVSEIKGAMNNFTQNWAAHNQQLRATGNVFHNHFVVLIVDETHHGASGCSIDSSVHFIKDLENKYQLDFFDRLTIAYQVDKKINLVHKNKIGALLESGQINEDTLVFNNLVSTKSDWESNWLVPLKNSWLAPVTSSI
jgi:hypothetical protein